MSADSYVDIVFDGPPSHDSGRFVEVEDADGRSINYGEWQHRDDGLWALRLPRTTIDNAEINVQALQDIIRFRNAAKRYLLWSTFWFSGFAVTFVSAVLLVARHGV